MGTQVFPNSFATRGSTNVTGSISGTELANLTYGETVTVTCDAGHKLSDQACNQREFSVTCDGNGMFSYTGSFSPSTSATSLRCEPVTCDVSGIPATNGTLNASTKVEKGQVATLTCNDGYRLHDSSLLTYPVPETSSKVQSYQCQDDCTFESQPKICRQQGCAAQAPWVETTDGLYDVTLDPAVAIGAGTKREFETVGVKCPIGYYVDSDGTEPASETVQTGVSTCQCNGVTPVCELTPVYCSRVACANFTVILVISYALLCAAFARK
jgi:hypothetical protein